jgi:hypothetical protein
MRIIQAKNNLVNQNAIQSGKQEKIVQHFDFLVKKYAFLLVKIIVP